MDINYYLIAGIILRLSSILLLLFIVIPRAYGEMRRPKNQFQAVRDLLFFIFIFFIVSQLFPLFYNATRLDTPSEFSPRNIAALMGNIGIFIFTLGWVIIYGIIGDITKKK